MGWDSLNSKVTGRWLGDCSSISIEEILFTLATMCRPSLWWKQSAIQWTQRVSHGQESSRLVNVNTHLNTGARNVWNSKLNPLVHFRGMLFSHKDCFIVVSENGTLFIIRYYNQVAHFSEILLYVKDVSSYTVPRRNRYSCTHTQPRRETGVSG